MKQDVKQIPPLVLAYIGDAVYELRVRRHLLDCGLGKMAKLHRQAVCYVNAERQSQLYAQLEPLLNEDELDILRRGRNSKSGHQPPTVSAAAYRRATGVEALFGYWHLSGQEQRIDMACALLFAASTTEADKEGKRRISAKTRHLQ